MKLSSMLKLLCYGQKDNVTQRCAVMCNAVQRSEAIYSTIQHYVTLYRIKFWCQRAETPCNRIHRLNFI